MLEFSSCIEALWASIMHYSSVLLLLTVVGTILCTLSLTCKCLQAYHTLMLLSSHGQSWLGKSPTIPLLLPQPCQTQKAHSPHRRLPLTTWHWWPGGIASVKLTGLKQLEKEFLAGYHPLGTAQRADWNATVVFLWKRSIYLSWNSAWWGGYRFTLF